MGADHPLPPECHDDQLRAVLFVVVIITSRNFLLNPFSILAKRKKSTWHGTEAGTDKANASVAAYSCAGIKIHNVGGANYLLRCEKMHATRENVYCCRESARRCASHSKCLIPNGVLLITVKLQKAQQSNRVA